LQAQLEGKLYNRRLCFNKVCGVAIISSYSLVVTLAVSHHTLSFGLA